jgi:hypothetical protein
MEGMHGTTVAFVSLAGWQATAIAFISTYSRMASFGIGRDGVAPPEMRTRQNCETMLMWTGAS